MALPLSASKNEEYFKKAYAGPVADAFVEAVESVGGTKVTQKTTNTITPPSKEFSALLEARKNEALVGLETEKKYDIKGRRAFDFMQGTGDFGPTQYTDQLTDAKDREKVNAAAKAVEEREPALEKAATEAARKAYARLPADSKKSVREEFFVEKVVEQLKQKAYDVGEAQAQYDAVKTRDMDKKSIPPAQPAAPEAAIAPAGGRISGIVGKAAGGTAPTR